MYFKKYVFILILITFFIITLNINNVYSQSKNIEYVLNNSFVFLKIDLKSIISIAQSFENLLPYAKEIRNEVNNIIESKTGFLYERDINSLVLSVLPEIDFKSKDPNNFLIAIFGNFQAEKIINELKKSKELPIEISKLSKFDFINFKKFNNIGGVFLNNSVFLVSENKLLEKIINNKIEWFKCNDAESYNLFNTSKYFLHFNLNDSNKKKFFSELDTQKTLPLIDTLFKTVKNITIFEKNNELVIHSEFLDKNSASDLKKFLDSFKEMIRTNILKIEKNYNNEILNVNSAFELLDYKKIINQIGIGTLKVIINSLEFESNNLTTNIKLKIPEELNDIIKPEYLPYFVGSLGILTVIAIPNFENAKTDAKIKACIANMKVIEGAVELYMMEHNDLDIKNLTIKQLVDDKYLKHHLYCPNDKKTEYKIIPLNDNKFDIECPIHGKLSTKTSK